MGHDVTLEPHTQFEELVSVVVAMRVKYIKAAPQTVYTFGRPLSIERIAGERN